MSKITNGTNRDIESILADIRIQAQRRMRLAEVQGITPFEELLGTDGDVSTIDSKQAGESSVQPTPDASDPTAVEAENTSNTRQRTETPASGLAHAYQQRAAAGRAQAADLPVILLKAETVSSRPETDSKAQGEDRAVRDESRPEEGISSPNHGGSTLPLSSALKNLQDGFARSSGGQNPVVGQAPALQPAAEPVPSNDNPSASEAGNRLSTLQSPQASPSTSRSQPESQRVLQKPASPSTSRASETGGAAGQQPVSRKMASFADTTMSRMAGSRPSDARSTTGTNAPAAHVPMAAPDPEPQTPSPTTSAPREPEAVESTNDSDSAGNGVHDVAAALLRPMLKDWVGENMPQIVEKALQFELSEMAKKDKKS